MREPTPTDGGQSFKIDVARIIDASSRRVAADELGGQVVRVVDASRIDEAIARAVDDALRAQETKLGRSLRREVGLEASRRFVDLMGRHQRAEEERREAHRARRKLEKELDALREQLAAERARLEGEHTKAAERAFSLSDDGLRELEAHLRRIVWGFVSDQRRRRALSPGGADLPELAELERVLGRVLHRVLVRERLAAARPLDPPSLRELENLTHRLFDLHERLGVQEREIAELRRLRSVPPRSPRGASTPRPGGNEKQAVLAVIFNENLKLRAQFHQAS